MKFKQEDQDILGRMKVREVQYGDVEQCFALWEKYNSFFKHTLMKPGRWFTRGFPKSMKALQAYLRQNQVYDGNRQERLPEERKSAILQIIQERQDRHPINMHNSSQETHEDKIFAALKASCEFHFKDYQGYQIFNELNETPLRLLDFNLPTQREILFKLSTEQRVTILLRVPGEANDNIRTFMDLLLISLDQSNDNPDKESITESYIRNIEGILRRFNLSEILDLLINAPTDEARGDLRAWLEKLDISLTDEAKKNKKFFQRMLDASMHKYIPSTEVLIALKKHDLIHEQKPLIKAIIIDDLDASILFFDDEDYLKVIKEYTPNFQTKKKKKQPSDTYDHDFFAQLVTIHGNHDELQNTKYYNDVFNSVAAQLQDMVMDDATTRERIFADQNYDAFFTPSDKDTIRMNGQSTPVLPQLGFLSRKESQLTQRDALQEKVEKASYNETQARTMLLDPNLYSELSPKQVIQMIVSNIDSDFFYRDLQNGDLLCCDSQDTKQHVKKKWIGPDEITEERVTKPVPIVNLCENDAEAAAYIARNDRLATLFSVEKLQEIYIRYFSSPRLSATHLQTLNVGPHETASQIKRKYMTLSKEYHFDKSGKEDNSAFQKLDEAYKALYDPIKLKEDFQRAIDRAQQVQIEAKAEARSTKTAHT